ncbi:MAG: hypothetical protein JWQ01_4268 [Massilia sp.]|jgi:hypothetical protein|nr:hypothetical protein [Massilia sp.]
MKPSAWLFAAAMSVTGLALAQTGSAVQESTDPAKIAEIERHAQALQSGSQPAPEMSEQEHMKRHGARHHKGNAKHRHHRAMKDKAASDQPMATESK